ncbi:MAG TPA: flagellar assembly protein FliW [Thermotogota bacterium]|nr:flagellar assembly protein FliW [Thermotogota bacterium]HPJ88720.1 flagellar assembly protein FliW [Thermotogota bacterium]HPR97650.1 flagellar assembly protein FliW [Thermotogota bacterium]
MHYKTNIGEIEIEEKDIITFNSGLPGFENLKYFALFALDETKPVQWLVSLEDESVSLPILDPWLVVSDYSVDIPDDIISFLKINNQEKVLVLTVVRIPDSNPESMTINLAAPVLVNLENNLAIQYIPSKSKYQLRHNVKEEIERSKRLLETFKDGE